MTSYQEGVLSLSYGKDSLACLGAIEKLGLPLTRIIHAEIWATETISADLPPMVEFKKKADEIIKAWWGIEVEHVCAMKDGKKLTYQDIFYRRLKPRNQSINQSIKQLRTMYGFPTRQGRWCTSILKKGVLDKNIRISVHRERVWMVPRTQDIDTTVFRSLQSEIGAPNSNRGFSDSPIAQGAKKNIVQYFGIAADEPERIARHENRDGVVLPLVLAGWDEAYCRKWCEENDLLSPIYTTATRSGCWFCHNQGVGQLRLLRKNYPDLWALLLKWDVDSPVTFHSDGHTVHDFDRRFQLEDEGLIFPDERFRWSMLDSPIQMRLDI